MTTLAILPVKGFGRAKQRLRAAVPDGPRAGLVEAMVGDVLAALGEVEGLAGVIVVTAEPAAAALAHDAGAEVVHDPTEVGQNEAVELGIARACARGAERVLLLPGDCPALDPADVETLLATAASVVVVPDRHGTGTNSLLLSPPRAIATAFGPGSRARHEAAAHAAGVSCRVLALETLGMDADTPEDLAALQAGGRLGVRTLATLERLARA